MKRIIFLLCAFGFIKTNAQSNILSLAGLKYIQSFNFIEYGNYYYCLHPQFGIQNPTISGVIAAKYHLKKIDKQTNHIISSLQVYGDLFNADSIVDSWHQYMWIAQGKIHMLYNKTYYPPPPAMGIVLTRYLQADTNLNLVIPEKAINCDFNFYHATPYKDGLAFYYWRNFDTFSYMYSKYIVLNGNGDHVKEDTVERKPNSSISADQLVVDILPYPSNRYLITGFTLGNPSKGFCLTDSNLNLLDTFYHKPTINFSWKGKMYAMQYFPTVVVLPTGSLISAGICDAIFSPGGRFSYAAKHTYTSRFSMDSIQVFEKADANDMIHSQWPATHNLAYNSHDNLVYFSNITNKGSSSPGSCGGSTYNFAQVISTDTNLVLRWRKFIYFGPDKCAFVSKISNPDARAGTIVVGYALKASDPTDTTNSYSFVFYVDSSGNSLGVKNSNIEIRDRIKIYPNPTIDYFRIDDIYHRDGKAYLFDLQGKLLKKYDYTSSSNQFSFKEYPQGLYLLRVITDDDEVYSFKIKKE